MSVNNAGMQNAILLYILSARTPAFSSNCKEIELSWSGGQRKLNVARKYLIIITI